MVKILPASAGDMGSSPGSRRFPGRGNDNHSSILAWEIPWTEELGGLQYMGLQKGWDEEAGRRCLSGFLLLSTLHF